MADKRNQEIDLNGIICPRDLIKIDIYRYYIERFSKRYRPVSLDVNTSKIITNLNSASLKIGSEIYF